MSSSWLLMLRLVAAEVVDGDDNEDDDGEEEEDEEVELGPLPFRSWCMVRTSSRLDDAAAAAVNRPSSFARLVPEGFPLCCALTTTVPVNPLGGSWQMTVSGP